MSEPSEPPSEPPSDPYRFGRPDHPVPPEYAPPGYVPDAPASGAPPYATQPSGGQPSGGQPYGGPPPGPYPGVPYPGSSYPGAPPPPTFHGYRQPRTGNGRAIAALVLGLLSILLCWLSVFDVVFVVLAVVFGLLVLAEARRGGQGRGLAIAGVACALVGAVLATILTVKIVHAADRCGGFSHDGVSNSDFRQCVSDNF